MQIKFEVSPKAIKNLEASIKKKISQVVEKVGVQVHNAVVTGNYPYYSGSYISSWNISKGSADLEYNEPSGLRSAWAKPEVIYDLNFLGGVSFGQRVYITNATPHARMVEFEGTPTHSEDGWFTATHARNQIVLTYKFK